MTTTVVENFPGFPHSITGPELMDHLRKQADRFGAQFIPDDVTRVDLAGLIKRVWVGEQAHQAQAVILATGSAWRPLGVTGEQELLGHGMSACATCDGFFFRDQDIAMVGGGDTAMEEATFLTLFARSVTIIHRRDTFRASRIMSDRALSNDKIHVAWNSVVEEILGHDGPVAGARLRDVHTGATRVWTSPACSWPSDMTRAASCSAARSRSTMTATSPSTPPEPAPTFRGVRRR